MLQNNVVNKLITKITFETLNVSSSARVTTFFSTLVRFNLFRQIQTSNFKSTYRILKKTILVLTSNIKDRLTHENFRVKICFVATFFSIFL